MDKVNSTLLALDTSTSITSCAIKTVSGEVIMDEYVRSASETLASHNEELQGLLRRCLDKAAIRTDKIDCLIVGAGPGSFTGLRIGFSFMKGLSFAGRIPLYPVSSLAGLAFSNGTNETLVAPICDARRGEVFSALFRINSSGGIKRVANDAILSFSDLAQTIVSELSTGVGGKLKVIAVSDSVQLVSRLKSELVAKGLSDGEIECRMAVKIAKGLIDAWEAGAEGTPKEFSLSDLAAVSPNYIRAVSARTIAERAAGNRL